VKTYWRVVFGPIITMTERQGVLVRVPKAS
jgi:hypothetical protein